MTKEEADLIIVEQNKSRDKILKAVAEIKSYCQELERENAELKSIADFQTSSNMDRYFQLKRSKEQLTKAKDIIKDYMIIAIGIESVSEENRCINVLKLNEQAEQFIKESEVKNELFKV